MISQTELRMEIPESPVLTPTLWIVLACYKGPGRWNGNWKQWGPFVSEEAAKQHAAELGKWYIRRTVWRMG